MMTQRAMTAVDDALALLPGRTQRRFASVGDRELHAGGRRNVPAVRRAIQPRVDRRFNRPRYDKRKTVDAFSVRLRDQIDLRMLHDELGAVIEHTMQPTNTSVWLARPKRQRDKPLQDS